ncbi:MAG TPA: hypothetical protein VHW71_04185 [Steroidobacteraceae bacterium]|jgi:hypothetical protein|nr:hypothetical protein [Steroidobacteraceae bacterium]
MMPTVGESSNALRSRFVALFPAAAAIAYPFLLGAFHRVVSSPDLTLSIFHFAAAALLLALAFAMPLSGLAIAFWLTASLEFSQSTLHARRLAYASIAAPSLFVFVGVLRGLLGLRMPEGALWIGLWTVAALYGQSGRGALTSRPAMPPPRAWRIAHGISAALIACFVLFHLANHLFGLLGPDTHAAIMKAGRRAYRNAVIEPLLVVLLLFQVASGVRLAWVWSGLRSDAYRIFQVGSGAYLAAYIVAHMNSALISARAVRKIDTDWSWASGAPVGLIHDAWDIRLLPHYALGVFFIVGHLSSGLRVVMLAHGVRTAVANRLWAVGMTAGVVISTAIVCALCGIRV